MNKPKEVDDPRHFRLKGKHSHAPDARLHGKKKVMRKIKKLAKTTAQSARSIVYESLADIPKAVSAQIPATQQIVQQINRIRQDPEAPKNPNKVSEIQFSEKQSKTKKGQNFILYDSGVNDDLEDFRILVFGTQENLDFLARCDAWYMDGTFNITPRLFTQLYTIHGRYDGHHVPLIWTLTTDKSQETYEDIFTKLLSLQPLLNPTDVTVDFEMATMNAIKKFWPMAEIHGCHFHLGKNPGVIYINICTININK